MKSEIFFIQVSCKAFFSSYQSYICLKVKILVIELGEERALNCLTLQVYKSTGLFITFITHVLCFGVVFAFCSPISKVLY